MTTRMRRRICRTEKVRQSRTMVTLVDEDDDGDEDEEVDVVYMTSRQVARGCAGR